MNQQRIVRFLAAAFVLAVSVSLVSAVEVQVET